MSTCWIEAVKAADVVFTVRLEDGKPGLFRDVADDKFGAALSGRKQLADWIYDGTRRWIGTDFPTKEQAKAFNLDFDAFAGMFWRALDVDYAELRARAEAVAAVMRGAGSVHITSPKGTDVTMRIDGRPLDLDVGVVSDAAKFSNLPAGEVCLAPAGDGGQRHGRLRPGFLERRPHRRPGDALRERRLSPCACRRRLRDVRRRPCSNATGGANVHRRARHRAQPGRRRALRLHAHRREDPRYHPHRRGGEHLPGRRSTTAACIGTCW